MAYIFLNNETEEAKIFGSITSLCDHAGIKKDNLYTVFSRNKKTEYRKDNIRIVKTEIIRSDK
jgi:hypothetical protein